MATFGENLKLLRKEKGFTLDELTNVLHTTKASLSRYENNKREPRAEFVEKVATYFEVSTDFLLGNTTIRDLSVNIMKNIPPGMLKMIKEAHDNGLTEEDLSLAIHFLKKGLI